MSLLSDKEQLKQSRKIVDQTIMQLPESAQIAVNRTAEELRKMMKRGTQNQRIIKFAALQMVALEMLEDDYVI